MRVNEIDGVDEKQKLFTIGFFLIKHMF